MSTIFLSDLISEAKKQKSYGILAYVTNPFRVLLAHPGGPESKSRNKGWWGIPKGKPSGGESKWSTACREFEEETGLKIPKGIKESDMIELGKIVQHNKKIVKVWAVQMESDDISGFHSNTFKMKWPRNDPTAKEKTYSEVDKVRYFNYDNAIRYIRSDQIPFLNRLFEILNQT